MEANNKATYPIDIWSAKNTSELVSKFLGPGKCQKSFYVAFPKVGIEARSRVDHFWLINLETCNQMLMDSEFQHRVLSRVGNNCRLQFPNSVIADLTPFAHIHTLNLSGCREIEDVSAFGGVDILDRSGCREIRDVSALGGVHTLDLSYCYGIKEVSVLSGVHTLRLSYCVMIEDFSTLGGVHTLDLSYCDNIEDVSALGGVHTLD